MGGYAPSLAELSDVEQHIDIYQIRRGNPNLQAVRFFSNELSISVGTKYISAEWFTRYSYDDKPIYGRKRPIRMASMLGVMPIREASIV